MLLLVEGRLKVSSLALKVRYEAASTWMGMEDLSSSSM